LLYVIVPSFSMLATIDLITAISTKINRHLSLHTAHMLLPSL
jgi:hypothetical protein